MKTIHAIGMTFLLLGALWSTYSHRHSLSSGSTSTGDGQRLETRLHKLNGQDMLSQLRLRMQEKSRNILSVLPVVYNNDTVMYMVRYDNEEGCEFIAAQSGSHTSQPSYIPLSKLDF